MKEAPVTVKLVGIILENIGIQAKCAKYKRLYANWIFIFFILKSIAFEWQDMDQTLYALPHTT